MPRTKAGEEVRKRLWWVANACRVLTRDNGRFLRETVEVCALRYDSDATKIDPLADTVRRKLYKLSLLKALLELRTGAAWSRRETAHRARLRNQNLDDFRNMMLGAQFPPADVFY